MAGSATNSAIEVAYWFISRAEDEGLFLEDEKLHHLLFLAQVHFALANNMELLMPSLFVCGENGFSEPNLAVMFAQGRPYMPPKKLSDKVSDFLGKVWKRYAPLSAKELNLMIKSNPAYQNCYISGAKTLPRSRPLLKILPKMLIYQGLTQHMPPQIRKFLIPRTDRWWFRNGIRVRFLLKSKRRKP